MDVNELIHTIAQKVLQQLQSEKQQPCVVVVAKREPVLAAQVAECVGQASVVFFWGEDTGARLSSRYIAPVLSCSNLADLALGRASDKLLWEVLRLLLSGVQVETLGFEYKKYAATAPDALYRQYEEYAKKLASYGLKELAPQKPEALRLRDTLVTEKTIIQAKNKGASALLIPMTALVTPLAAEVAQNLNINITKSV